MWIRITNRRKAILEYVNKHINEWGFSPTIREIAKEVNIPSTSVTQFNIDRLVEAGLIERKDNLIRGITKVHLPESDYVLSKFPRQATLVTKGRKPRDAGNHVSALEYFWGCAYCGSNDTPLELDHFLPITLGGSNNPCNLLPACLHCNRSKSDREPIDWILKNFNQETLSNIINYLCAK